MIVDFKASNFENSSELHQCLVDEDFVPYLNKMNIVAINHKMIVIVTSAGRLDTIVKGAIVKPAEKGNHLVYHAIDCNAKDSVTGEYYNSMKMGDGVGKDQLFFRDVVLLTGLRWGQAFKKPDSVHFDDMLNLKNPELWIKKYNLLHNIV